MYTPRFSLVSLKNDVETRAVPHFRITVGEGVGGGDYRHLAEAGGRGGWGKNYFT